jgi:hypothetical protein
VAKKRKTPPPPRKVQPDKRTVQAPKQRAGATAARAPRNPGRTRMKLVLLVVAVVVIALAAGLGIALGGGDSTPSGLTAGGCVPYSLEEQGREHAVELPAGYKYNSFPPTSGTHHPRPAIYNVYEDPVRQLLLVHNLEHGAIVVQYGEDVPETQVEQIRSWYAEDPVGKVVSPLPALGDKVAVTAWTQLMTCPGFNEQAFDAFTEAHRYKGPERFSPDAMQPGT